MELTYLRSSGKHEEQHRCPHSSNCTGYLSGCTHTGHSNFLSSVSRKNMSTSGLLKALAIPKLVLAPELRLCKEVDVPGRREVDGRRSPKSMLKMTNIYACDTKILLILQGEYSCATKLFQVIFVWMLFI